MAARSSVERSLIVSATSLLLLAVSGAGCASSTEPKTEDPVVETVTVTPSSTTLTVGDTMTLVAAASDANGNALSGLSATWSSADESVASVAPSGLVTALDAGEVDVTATMGGVAGSATLTVMSAATNRTVFLTEAFEDTDVSSRGWFDNTSFTLTTAEKHAGSSSLEWHYSPGDKSPDFGISARIEFTETESVFVSYWIKFSDNWVGSGEVFHPHEVYLLTNADGRFIGPAETHLTAYIEHNYQDGVRPVAGIQDALNVDQDQIGVDLTGVTESRGAAGCNGQSDGYPTDCYETGSGLYRNGKFWAGSVFLTGTAGPRYKSDWHFIEAYFELNTIVGGIGQNDGVVRYWIDGELLLDMADVLLRTGAQPTLAFKELLLGPYIGSGSPVDQAIWIDDLTVADSR